MSTLENQMYVETVSYYERQRMDIHETAKSLYGSALGAERQIQLGDIDAALHIIKGMQGNIHDIEAKTKIPSDSGKESDFFSRQEIEEVWK